MSSPDANASHGLIVPDRLPVTSRRRRVRSAPPTVFRDEADCEYLETSLPRPSLPRGSGAPLQDRLLTTLRTALSPEAPDPGDIFSIFMVLHRFLETSGRRDEYLAFAWQYRNDPTISDEEIAQLFISSIADNRNNGVSQ